MEKRINRGSLSMVKLTLPLAFEQFFRILVSSVDTMMLSSYSNEAVAAVGLVSQYVFFLNLIFSVIGTGTSIVLAQYLGAEKSEKQVSDIIKASYVMMILVCIFITLLVLFGTAPLLSCYTLEESVRTFAWQYFVIYGGLFCIFNGINLLQGAILRCYGYTKESMIVSIVANIVNVVGNALSLYGFFGLPILGVPGVAASSGISMVVSCLMFSYYIRQKKDINFSLKKITKIEKESFKTILKVGVPTAGESLSYNVAQIVIMAMISTLGTYAMSAQVYCQSIVRFVFAIAVSMGHATQIKAGYYVGSKQNDLAYKNIFKYQLVATACSMVAIAVVNVIKSPIVSIFTDIPEIHSLVCDLLLYSILIEFGRTLNLIYVGALKGAGNVKFPVFYGIVSMWIIMVLGSYILGLKMGMGLIGFWLAIGAEETSRGVVMLLRWKSRRWQKYALV